MMRVIGRSDSWRRWIAGLGVGAGSQAATARSDSWHPCCRVARVPAIGGIATIVHCLFQIALRLAAKGRCRHRQGRRGRPAPGLQIVSHRASPPLPMGISRQEEGENRHQEKRYSEELAIQPNCMEAATNGTTEEAQYQQRLTPGKRVIGPWWDAE
jgi:hypothetical protein